MKLMDKINGNAQQHHIFITDSGSQVDIKMYFLPRINQWIFDLEYKELKIYGQPLVLGFNLLRQWMNLIDFGILLASDDGIDPFRQDDFSTGRVKFYLLNTDDIQQIEVNVYGG